MKNATLYFHYPCFDGLVSAVLAWVYLEHCEGWRIEQFYPVKYDVRESWLSTELSTPTAIVDFLYHPKACFWADHHLTTFITQDAREDFERRKASDSRRRDGKAGPDLVFDGRASSCASLLWEQLRSRIPDAGRYEEMARWADKIDSARYSTVHEAILGDSPALRISRSLELLNGDDYSRVLLTELRSGDLSRVATLPAVSTNSDEVTRRIVAGLKRLEGHVRLHDGSIAIFDVPARKDEIISRYAPFHFFPEARYSIGTVRSSNGIRITAMRNPWKEFESIPLGKVLEAFGGGGHQRVGAVVIPNEQAERVQLAVECLLSEMCSQSPVERVTA